MNKSKSLILQVYSLGKDIKFIIRVFALFFRLAFHVSLSGNSIFACENVLMFHVSRSAVVLVSFYIYLIRKECQSNWAGDWLQRMSFCILLFFDFTKSKKFE
jgi:hypothetical protein